MIKMIIQQFFEFVKLLNAKIKRLDLFKFAWVQTAEFCMDSFLKMLNMIIFSRIWGKFLAGDKMFSLLFTVIEC